MDIITLLAQNAVLAVVLGVVVGWLIERITGERRTKELKRQYLSLKLEMDKIVENQKRLEDAAGSGREKQGE